MNGPVSFLSSDKNAQKPPAFVFLPTISSCQYCQEYTSFALFSSNNWAGNTSSELNYVTLLLPWNGPLHRDAHGLPCCLPDMLNCVVIDIPVGGIWSKIQYIWKVADSRLIGAVDSGGLNWYLDLGFPLKPDLFFCICLKFVLCLFFWHQRQPYETGFILQLDTLSDLLGSGEMRRLLSIAPYVGQKQKRSWRKDWR